MDKVAEAFLKYGDASDWQGKEPSYSIGTLFPLCSWPEWDGFDKKKATETIRIWRSPHQLSYGGMVWDENSRFDTIKEWKPEQATGWFLFDFLRQLKQLTLDYDAFRRPLVVPWGKGWGGDGGTTDNGVIVYLNKERTEAYEIQGLAPLNEFDVFLINMKAAAEVARIGDYRVDGVSHRKAGNRPVGSQGPKWKSDGLLRPEHMRSMSKDKLRLVLFNNQWGPQAKAAKGGWVEHKTTLQPYALGIIKTPTGDDPRMVPCFQEFYFDITDLGIEQWISSEETPASLVESRRWFARNLRGWETDAQKPRNPGGAFISAEGGSGIKLIESVGWVNPDQAAQWLSAGIRTAKDAQDLGKNIFRFGTVVAVG